MQNAETRISSETVYSGRVFRLTVDQVMLPDGRQTKREVIQHPGAVVMLAVNEEGKVLLVRQYRYAAQEELWELPAGTLEPGEEPLHAAGRELAEETGFGATEFEPLFCMYSAPGFCSERLWLYRASGLFPQSATADSDEFISVRAFSRQELREMMTEGQIKDAKTLVGLLHHLRA